MMSAGLMSSTRRLAQRAPGLVYGFTSSDYYSGPSGSGRGTIGTVRLVFRVESVPSAHGVIAGRMNGSPYGWRIDTGIAAGSLSVIAGGSGGWYESSRHTIVNGDIGTVFVLHAWMDGGLKIAIDGTQVGSVTSSFSVSDPGSVPVWIGSYTGGFASPDLGVVALSASPTSLNATQVAADASAILGSGAWRLPVMPGQDMHFEAADVFGGGGGDWHDRSGDDCTLTETGSISVLML